jgi:tetratricopeptide (TPR) repeat protein
MAGGDVVLHALANHYLGLAYWCQGKFPRAINCFRQTVASLDGSQCYERFGQWMLPASQSRNLLAVIHAELGMFAEGKVFGEEGLQIAEAAAHPWSLMCTYWARGMLFLYQGDLHQALPQLEHAVGLCQDIDGPIWFPRIAASLGAAYTLSGRVTDAVPLLMQAMEQSIAVRRDDLGILCTLPLGEAHMLAGHLDKAYIFVERVLAYARKYQEPCNQAYALRRLGDIAARHDPPQAAQAEIYYHEALTLAEKLGMRPLQAHCHLGLGTLYANQDQPEQARVELSTAIALYRAMDMAFWLPQAEAALAQASRSSASLGARVTGEA